MVDLGELLIRSIEENLAVADQTRIQFDERTDVSIVGDPVRLERVIVNLLSNACKYSPPMSQVIVQISRTNIESIFSVTDQGIGIGADDLPHVFERRFRARTAEGIEGTGLGLYGSRLIVEAHDGKMWVQSELGRGSRFMFSLPVIAIQEAITR